MHCPQAKRIRLVQDNLNTHDGASLYETFSPAEARRILDKIEFHDTPKHGSWLNMAETEINIMNSQCLNRRLDSQPLIAAEVAAWEKKRNLAKARIHWTFTLAAARRKLRKLYPSISPFAQSISNFLNFKLPIESSTQPLSLQDILLQP